MELTITEIRTKLAAGEPLAENEFHKLQEFTNLEKASKLSFDFGEIQDRIACYGLERNALIERNQRWADNNPHKRGGGYVLGQGSQGLISLDDCRPDRI